MRFGGIVVAALVMLGACSSDPEPKEPDPPQGSTSAATPTATVPTMPAQAGEDSPEGAAAFVHHYVDVFNYAAATGDVAELSRLSSSDCTGCQSYIKLYRDTYQAGGYFKGGEWKLGSVRIEFDESETYATTVVRSGGGMYRVSRDRPELASKTAKTKLTFALDNAANRQITQLALGGAA